MITHLLAGVDRAMTSNTSYSGDDYHDHDHNYDDHHQQQQQHHQQQQQQHKNHDTNSINNLILDSDERLLIIDLTRLLHCMKYNESPKDESWQSLLLRAQLAQDIWYQLSSTSSTSTSTSSTSSTSLINRTNRNPNLYRHLAQQVDFCCRRAHEIALQRQQQQQCQDEDENDDENDDDENDDAAVTRTRTRTTSRSSIAHRVERLFFQPTTSPSLQQQQQHQEVENDDENIEMENDFLDDTEFLDDNEEEKEEEKDDDDNHQKTDGHYTTTTATTTTTTTTNKQQMEELQQLQREQMEDAISSMVYQMKVATSNIHSTIQQQTNVVLDEIETVAEQNVNDVTQVVTNLQNHHQQRKKTNFGTWTLFFTLIGIFIFVLMIIFTIPKRHDACILFCSSSTTSSSGTSTSTTASPSKLDKKWEQVFEENDLERQEKERLAKLLQDMQQQHGSGSSGSKNNNLPSSSSSQEKEKEKQQQQEEQDNNNQKDTLVENIETDDHDKKEQDEVSKDDHDNNADGADAHKDKDDHAEDKKSVGDDDKKTSEEIKPSIVNEELGRHETATKKQGRQEKKPMLKDQTDLSSSKNDSDAFDEKIGTDEEKEDEEEDETAILQPIKQVDIDNRWDSHPDKVTVKDYESYKGHGTKKLDELLDSMHQQDTKQESDQQQQPQEEKSHPKEKETDTVAERTDVVTDQDEENRNQNTTTNDNISSSSNKMEQDQLKEEHINNNINKTEDTPELPNKDNKNNIKMKKKEEESPPNHDDPNSSSGGGDEIRDALLESIRQKMIEEQEKTDATNDIAWENHGKFPSNSMPGGSEKMKRRQIDLGAATDPFELMTAHNVYQPPIPDDAFSRRSSARVHFSPRDLRVAAANGDLELVQTYIQAKPEYLDRKDKNGWSPLHMAARAGHVAVFEYLMEVGAEFTMSTKDNFVPLSIAVERWGEEHPISKLLRAAGAKLPHEAQDEGHYDNYIEEGRSKLDKLLGSFDDDEIDDEG